MAPFIRLRKNKEYRKVYKFGRSVADRNMVLFVLANNLGVSRIGFTVSKKVGKAVIRNKVRRLFKEACRLNLQEFPLCRDYILLARNNVVGKSYHVVENSLLHLLKRLRIPKG